MDSDEEATETVTASFAVDIATVGGNGGVAMGILGVWLMLA